MGEVGAKLEAALSKIESLQAAEPLWKWAPTAPLLAVVRELAGALEAIRCDCNPHPEDAGHRDWCIVLGPLAALSRAAERLGEKC